MDATATVPRLFDADNHYWEASDAFTRHRDPALGARGVQVKQIDGVPRYVVDDEVFEILPGPADARLDVHLSERRAKETRTRETAWRCTTS